MPTRLDRSTPTTRPWPKRMTSPPSGNQSAFIRLCLLVGLSGAVAGSLGGCGSEADLEAPAPAPAPGTSKVVALDGSASNTQDPAAQPGAASDASGPVPPTSPGETSSVLAHINEARAVARLCGSASLPAALPLSANADTEEAADLHTRWMQANRIMSHTGDSGSTVGSRLTGTGYHWSAVGENVATGQGTPAAVVAAWLASPGHCANIMNAGFVDVGFGFAPATAGAPTYATLVLARPR